MKTIRKKILITGATSGLGKKLAIFFDKKNYLIKGWETIDLYGNRVRSNIIVKNINQELSDNIFNLNLYN